MKGGTGSRVRIGVLMAVFALGLGVVLVHLWWLMVGEHDVWARRSYENRSAFRSVPSQRGALRDRDGEALAVDEPTTRVSVHYAHFRRWHCVGAAVHGAIRWARLQPGREQAEFGYREGKGGPAAAARTLLSVPVRALSPGVLPKAVAADLATCATTVLALCSGRSRREVYSAMRESAQRGERKGLGDVLPVSRRELLQRFDERLRALYELDRRLLAVQEQRIARGVGTEGPAAPRGLVATLERLRVASLTGERQTWTDAYGRVHLGSRKEDIRFVFASDVPFELAAPLRVDYHNHRGIDVEPGVRRTRRVEPGTSLSVLLGKVTSIDRTQQAPSLLSELFEGEPEPTWLDRHLVENMPAGWLDGLVPEGLLDDEARERMIDEARARYRHEMLVRERRGISGFESWFNRDLMGQLGMRFVEHDNRRREHLLWSQLQVRSGSDVAVTIDLDLQRAAEAAVRDAIARQPREYANRKYLAASMVVIDAHTGDILCLAGSPITSGNASALPGLTWAGNGAIGSVVKPFVAIEHFEAQRFGRPFRVLADIEPCRRYFRYGDRRLSCDGTHLEQGRDARSAIALSCNCFFYQVGLGLGEEGLQRALRRFGLIPAAGADDPFRASWQDEIEGMATAQGRMHSRQDILPRRSIGYGVEVSPVHVARAYAALATGALPTLSLRAGEARPRVALGVPEDELEVVRQGLRDVLTASRGTGRRLALLKELGVRGKTGTAEVSAKHGNNNAWFAGFLPWPTVAGHQLSFCGVVYFVPDQTHGATAAGEMLETFFRRVQADPVLARRYLKPAEAR